MAGKLAGFYFKAVIGSLIGASILYPEEKRRVEQMIDDEWYDWDEYVRMVSSMATKLKPSVVTHVGSQIVTKAKDIFVSQGFTSADQILERYENIFNANIKGAPPQDLVRTIRFAPGVATIEAGVAQSAPLVEGYLRGIVTMYGGFVESVETTTVQGPPWPANHITIRWT